MCPSFSLWAWRILKMRSCLRSPLAPGRSRDRAILVSSVIFFSLSSAMVIITYRRFSRGDTGEDLHRGSSRRGWLGSPPLRLGHILRLGKNRLPLRACNPIQHFVHSFLDAGIGLVKLASCLGRKLTQHITVSQRL